MQSSQEGLDLGMMAGVVGAAMVVVVRRVAEKAEEGRAEVVLVAGALARARAVRLGAKKAAGTMVEVAVVDAAMVAVVRGVAEKAMEGMAEVVLVALAGDGVGMMVDEVGAVVVGRVAAMQDNKSHRPSWPRSQSSSPCRSYSRG